VGPNSFPPKTVPPWIETLYMLHKRNYLLESLLFSRVIQSSSPTLLSTVFSYSILPVYGSFVSVEILPPPLSIPGLGLSLSPRCPWKSAFTGKPLSSCSPVSHSDWGFAPQVESSSSLGPSPFLVSAIPFCIFFMINGSFLTNSCQFHGATVTPSCATFLGLTSSGLRCFRRLGKPYNLYFFRTICFVHRCATTQQTPRPEPPPPPPPN